MKSFKLFLFALIAVAIATGCTADPDKVLTKKDGSWNISQQQTKTTNDGQLFSDVTVNNAGTITFDGNGTGIIVDDTSSTTFDWTYSDEREEITITDETNAISVWEVQENKSDYQQWRNFQTFTLFGSTSTVEIIIDLDRLK